MWGLLNVWFNQILSLLTAYCSVRSRRRRYLSWSSLESVPSDEDTVDRTGEVADFFLNSPDPLFEVAVVVCMDDRRSSIVLDRRWGCVLRAKLIAMVVARIMSICFHENRPLWFPSSFVFRLVTFAWIRLLRSAMRDARYSSLRRTISCAVWMRDWKNSSSYWSYWPIVWTSWLLLLKTDVRWCSSLRVWVATGAGIISRGRSWNSDSHSFVDLVFWAISKTLAIRMRMDSKKW